MLRFKGREREEGYCASSPAPPGSLATAPPRAIKHNAVQWLLFYLIAAASSLDGRCRLRGMSDCLCLTRGMEEDQAARESIDDGGSLLMWESEGAHSERKAAAVRAVCPSYRLCLPRLRSLSVSVRRFSSTQEACGIVFAASFG